MISNPPSARPATQRLAPDAWLAARDCSRLLGAWVARAVFLRADVCRRELLVEIEGQLWLGAV